MILEFFSLSNLIKYYWIIGPFLLFFSGEITIISFGILCIRYPKTINLFILMTNCILTSFISEEFFFFLPKFSQKKLKKYEKHWLFNKVINQDHKTGLLLFALSRFFPILRMITPIALGTTNISVKLFSLVNFIISFIWCIGFLFIGLFIGKKTINLKIENIFNLIINKYNYFKTIFFKILMLLIIIGIIFYLIYNQLKKFKYIK
jgi:membrane protein DedA with SNARE-associated domain